MERLDAYLLLGCNGLVITNNFRNCSGVENIIINLRDLEDEPYQKVVEFFDQACGLFDSPVYDYNKCTNILTTLYRDHQLISQAQLHNIQLFLKTHKTCGIFLFLLMREEEGA